MKDAPVSKTMDRDDLLTPDGTAFVTDLNRLAETIERHRLPVTSWYGALTRPPLAFSVNGLKAYARRLLGGARRVGPTATINRGGNDYQPVPGIARDEHHPWFLYWEAFWVTAQGPALSPATCILDAGGAGSLLSYFLASRGAEVHAVDANPGIAAAAQRTARAMGWKLRNHCMDVVRLDFPDACFDHAYSFSILTHLDAGERRRALAEIARVLKPGGILSLTFDYGAPGVMLRGRWFNYDDANAIRSHADVERHFLSADGFESAGSGGLHDNGKRYLAWPENPAERYTFGALFLRRTP